MITHVRTIGFKGFDIDEDIPNKVIYTGSNKSGKSTRAAAIALCIYGHIPFSDVGKKPGEILDSFGKESLVVAIKIKDTEFARKFSRNSKGGASQSVQIDKKRVASENFAIKLSHVGAPRIADTAEFMKQSETKKIDTLFELFPNETLVNIDSEIEAAKEDVSKWNDKITGVKSTVKRLTESKTNIELPSGSVAEIKAEIKDIDTKVADLENQIKEAEIKETEIKAKEAGKKEEKEEAAQRTLAKMESLKQQPEPQVEQNTTQDQGGMGRDEAVVFIKGMTPNSDDTPGDACIQNNSGFEDAPLPFFTSDIVDQNFSEQPPVVHGISERSSNTIDQLNPSVSIKKIIEAMQSVGCGTCAALIVAKIELKKYKGMP